jgi:hypothetical protein
MKLNFWQWLGIALLLLGVVWLIYREVTKPAATKHSLLPPTHLTADACPMIRL